MDAGHRRRVPPVRHLGAGALCLALAAGCSTGPAGSGSPGAPSSPGTTGPSVTAATTAEGATTQPSLAATVEPSALSSADPVGALTGRPVEALGPGGVDVVLRIGAGGFRLPDGERLYDVEGDRVLAARRALDGGDATLVLRDLDGGLVREIATGMDVPQTGIVRGQDVYFAGIDLGEGADELEDATDRGVWVARADGSPEPVLAAQEGLAVYTAIERSPDGRTVGIWRCGERCSTILVRAEGSIVEIPKPGLIALADDVALLIGAYSDVTAHGIADGAVLWQAETDGIYYGRYATSDGRDIVLSAVQRREGETTDELRIQLLDALSGAVRRDVVVPTNQALLWVARSLSTDRYVALLDRILPNSEDGPHDVQVVDLQAQRLLDVTLRLGDVR